MTAPRERTYAVSGWAPVNVFTRVRARSKTEAIEKALERSIAGLCHQCEGGLDGQDAEEWVFNGASDAEVEEDSVSAEEIDR